MKIPRPALAAPLSITVFVLLVAACSSDSPTERPGGSQGSVRVIVEAVETKPQRTQVEAVGTSRAAKSVTLYPVTSGEVTAVNFEPGQVVEKGEVLLEMDQRNEQLAVDLAELRVSDAERLYNRYRQSAASGATLPTTLDEAQTALEEARIQLSQARIALDDRSIEAPFAGHVGLTDVDAGDRIQPSTAITTLDDRSQLLVSFDVPEVLIEGLRAGDAIAIATWNSREAAAYGEIVDIDSRIDPDTRTFVARAEVDNSADNLRPGQSFRVSLDLQGKSYPILPEVSVQWGADGAYVWSVAGKQVRRVPINVVQRQEGRVLAEGLLNEGDLIIVEGLQRVRPGVEVDAQRASSVERESDSLSRANSDKGPG